MIPMYSCLFERLRRHIRSQNSRIKHTLKFLLAIVPSIYLKNLSYS